MGAQRPAWLPSDGPGNRNVPPEKWGMTLRQWAAFIMGCRLCMEEWEELEASTESNSAAAGEEQRHVNLYQICDRFVKPWTRNLGNSVALLLNRAEPLQAEVMISHAWGECILESVGAVLGRASINGLSMDTVIWFCTFAQYQPGDEPGDCGPGVAEQLALDPFQKVIASSPRYGMMVIHTSVAELYGRLWCVFEVNASQDDEVLTTAAASMRYFYKVLEQEDSGMSLEDMCEVQSEEAKCWSPDDAALIKGKIEEGIGYEALNNKIKNFRLAALMRMKANSDTLLKWAEPISERTGCPNLFLIRSLVETVDASAYFVALHCLTTVALEAGAMSEEYKQAIMQMAREPTTLVQGGAIMTQRLNDENGEEMETLPPGFDAKKRVRDHVIVAHMDDDELLWCSLQDMRDFQMAFGWLEFGAGGSAMAAAREHAGGDSMKAVKETFHRFDTDGSGSISYKEMAALLKSLNPSFSDNDIESMLQAADANNDGQIDFNEFVDWLGAGL